MPLQGKIAIEEHFVPAGLEQLITSPGWSESAFSAVVDRLTDFETRLERMDENGVELAVLSLGSNGIQDVLDGDEAVRLAAECNDALAAVVAERPDRFAALAALPMHDPAAAAAELARAVNELGMKGALVNGYTSVGTLDVGRYYDEAAYRPFWEQVATLGVPFYLHPRNPLPDQRRIYDHRPELLGPTWAFGVETGTHALRLITSGLFDELPGLQIILGHLGELLPFAIRRLEQRLLRRADITLREPASHYLRENFHLTTSGNYHTASLIGIILELGSDRLMFAADYPFEELEDGARWMDTVPISEVDRQKIGRDNARRLFGL